jgi:aryl-alcohol dehydrogenase-like predicted oxidoreductase
MRHRRLGNSGLQVPPLCLGTMTFGLQVDEATSFEILDEAFANQLTFLDTADVYPLGGDLSTIGETERILGRWMKSRGVRDQVQLASKCFAPMAKGPNNSGLSRVHIKRAIEASLSRLQTDHIDLYQSHGFDPKTPIEESLRAFEDLTREGKVRYVGCSNYPAWRLSEALSAASSMRIEGYVSVQPRYNLLYREIETELLPLCESAGLGVIVYNPLAGGFLSGKYAAGQSPEEGTRFTLGTAAERYQYRYWQDAQFAEVEKLKLAVDARNLSLVTVSVAWVLRQAGITSAIIGASKATQLAANLDAVNFEWDDELLALCDAAWWALPRRPVQEGYR